VSSLPTVNAILNFISAILLLLGYIAIKRQQQSVHKRWMLAAMVSSALFLISYLFYHYNVGSVPYPHYDWTRFVYFVILVPHIILAAVMVPFILVAVYFAFRGRFDKHRMLTVRVWPVWMFVSLSGLAVYLMLYWR
jgi:putative membrane protein